jgi:1,4-alpha-glucan branching enzyme
MILCTPARAAVLLTLAVLGCAPAVERAPAARSGPEPAEGGVVFRYSSTSARSVHLVGDFNNWSTMADAMADANADGEWTLFYPLEPGRYAYKFVVDGKRWISDPTNALHEPDGFGDLNSIVVVPGAPPGTR